MKYIIIFLIALNLYAANDYDLNLEYLKIEISTDNPYNFDNQARTIVLEKFKRRLTAYLHLKKCNEDGIIFATNGIADYVFNESILLEVVVDWLNEDSFAVVYGLDSKNLNTYYKGLFESIKYTYCEDLELTEKF